MFGNFDRETTAIFFSKCSLICQILAFLQKSVYIICIFENLSNFFKNLMFFALIFENNCYMLLHLAINFFTVNNFHEKSIKNYAINVESEKIQTIFFSWEIEFFFLNYQCIKNWVRISSTDEDINRANWTIFSIFTILR